MTAERWERVKKIVADAMDLASPERPLFVAGACEGDQDLRAEVETLLRADDPASPVLDLDRIPKRIGAYRIVREIGRGGMGTVYLGERDDGQFEQKVAVKVIKRGMDSEAVLRRFYAERRILARMQHPGITRIIDGGMFEDRPYFVMEYVEGEPFLEYCRKRELSLTARIRLFLDVCGAVEHAHRNLILHRDIKSGNIVVDRSGAPKLLDFGIAKVLEEDALEGTVEVTAIAQRPLTPQSASPEQVRGEPLTMAADVYSLGLLLFDLLAGVRPYDVATSSYEEMARVICQKPAPKPSAVAPAAAARQLSGDLDNIVLKALEKNPADRYQSAADLSADLRAWFEGRPVTARSGGAFYRARKFAWRHARALGIAAVVLAAIGVAAGDAIVQGRRAARRFQEVRQLAGSFLFEFYDSISDLPGSTPARELVVKRALQYLDGLKRESSGDLDLKREVAESYLRIGDVQGQFFESNLGRPAEARASYRKALALFDEVVARRPGDDGARIDRDIARLHMAALVQNGKDRKTAYEMPRAIASDLEEIQKRHPLGDQGELALGMAYFGIAESSLALRRVDESLAARLHSIDVLQRLTGRNPGDQMAQRQLALTEKRLGYLYIVELRDFPKAAATMREVAAIDQERVDRNPTSATAKLDLALDRSYLSGLAQRTGDLNAAIGLMRQCVTTYEDMLGVDPRNFRVATLLLGDYAKLASMLHRQGKATEARAVFDSGYRLSSTLDPHNTEAANEITTFRRIAAEAGVPR